jgi:hypothetical protein
VNLRVDDILGEGLLAHQDLRWLPLLYDLGSCEPALALKYQLLATTSICNSCKVELMQAAHCMQITYTPAASAGASGAFTLTGLTSTAGIATGMLVTGTNVGTAPNYVTSIDSASAVHVSVANAGTVTSGTVVFTGDSFKISLIKVSPTGTYNNTLSNAGTPNNSTGGTPSATNIGTDEVAASGTYAAGGMALTNVSPILSTNTACGSFSNVSITGATISTVSAVIYNTTTRLGASTFSLSANRTISNHDFGGTQTVTSGTMTLTMPTQAAGTSLLQIA